MNENQQAAFIMAQAACAQARIAGMVAENMQRQACDLSMAYDESDFASIVTEFKIGWNDVIGYFKGE
jgi:hypothetical protein